MEPRPLSEGNPLQRRYARWAERHYARMEPEVREQAVLVDRYLYSLRGLPVWLGLAGAVVGTAAGLRHAGLPLGLAIGVAAMLWVGLVLTLLAAWLQPRKFTGGQVRRKLPQIAAMAIAGGLLGLVGGQVARHGELDLQRLGAGLWRGVALLVPGALAGATAMMTLAWAVARMRRQVLQRAVERERLARERDTAARQAVESRLHLLQAQVQPHFVFNTLAALQHWVDQGDARAGPLLRALTAFLRGSTELLGRDRVTLGEEAETVRQYLSILQARLGDRLRFELRLSPEVAARTLPPGLLLTLVENAVEHGVQPALQGATVVVESGSEPGGWWIAVRDDGAGLPPDWHEGIGLANVRQRLGHAFGGRASLALQALPRGTEARIRVRDEAAA